ncbi:MAG TPA: hypothetical protein VLZ83_04000 [Edaphocola sp.]|nr:hypothetical protein [Edaphocola sp.]
MKKTTLIIAISLLTTGTFLFAQQKNTQKHRITRTEARQNADARAKATTNRMTKELNLTQEQQSKIKVLVLENYQKQNNSFAEQEKLNQEIDKLLTSQQKQLKKQISDSKIKAISTENHKRVASPAK